MNGYGSYNQIFLVYIRLNFLLRILHLYLTYFPNSQEGFDEVVRQIFLTTIPFGAERTPLECQVQQANVGGFPPISQVVN